MYREYIKYIQNENEWNWYGKTKNIYRENYNGQWIQVKNGEFSEIVVEELVSCKIIS